jgi:hypothetical protein
LDSHAIEDVFIDYTEHSSQYLVWMPERKKVIKATNLIFIEDGEDQQMPEQPKISELDLDLTELGRAQQERA